MKTEKITMAHGAGGTIMQDWIRHYVVKYFGSSNVDVPLEALDDAAVVDDIVLKSDSHTVKPLFFPSGDIGRLKKEKMAVCTYVEASLLAHEFSSACYNCQQGCQHK